MLEFVNLNVVQEYFDYQVVGLLPVLLRLLVKLLSLELQLKTNRGWVLLNLLDVMVQQALLVGLHCIGIRLLGAARIYSIRFPLLKVPPVNPVLEDFHFQNLQLKPIFLINFP